MRAAIDADAAARVALDDIVWAGDTVTAEGLAAAYQNLSNCDPAQDLILAEVQGEVICTRHWGQIERTI